MKRILLLLIFPGLLWASTKDLCSVADPAMQTITIEMGDWAADGHGQTAEVLLCSNLGIKEMRKYYKDTRDKLKIDLVEEIAEEFDENTIPSKDVKKLWEAGAKFELEDIESVEKEEKVYISTDEYAEIYLQMVKLAHSNFKYQKVKLGPSLNIGGYGLFSF